MSINHNSTLLRAHTVTRVFSLLLTRWNNYPMIAWKVLDDIWVTLGHQGSLSSNQNSRPYSHNMAYGTNRSPLAHKA